MNIQMTDVTLHIDENLDEADLNLVEEDLRENDGVISVHREGNRPHLMMVEYNPDRVTSHRILSTITNQGLHAELIGL